MSIRYNVLRTFDSLKKLHKHSQWQAAINCILRCDFLANMKQKGQIKFMSLLNKEKPVVSIVPVCAFNRVTNTPASKSMAQSVK